MPILGVIASSISGNLYSASYDSIATTTVGAGGAANVSFTSIPSTYTHLQVRILCRTDYPSSYFRNLTIRFNSDTGSNYANHYLIGDGTSASGGGDINVTEMYIGTAAAATANANVFAGNVVDIFDYANTNKFKTVKNLHGFDNNGNGTISMRSGLWRSTSAITSITFDLEGNWNFNQYSSFALYGLKVA